MNAILSYLLLLILSFQVLLAADDSEVKKMSALLLRNNPLTQQDQCKLAILAINSYHDLKKQILIVKLSGTEKESRNASELLTRLDDRVKNKVNAHYFGVEVIWFLTIEKGKYSSLPMISKVTKGSPASKAGLLPGDVIDTCHQHPMKSPASRNNFIRFIRLWPKDTPVVFKIRRSHHSKELRNPADKTRKRTLTLTLK